MNQHDFEVYAPNDVCVNDYDFTLQLNLVDCKCGPHTIQIRFFYALFILNANNDGP